MINLKNYLVVLSSPRSVTSEAFRSVRTNLQGAIGEGLKSMALVSSWGAEGKSVTCANLAAAFAQLFFDVVLVDGDLRRPTLSRLFGCEQSLGLAEHLQKSEVASDLSSLVVKSDIPNLSFLPAGQVQGNPADVLAGPALGRAISSLEQQNRFVVMDTPPLTACSDALMIGSKVGGVVMVVNPSRWHGDVEVKLKDSMLLHQIRLLGVILNGVDSRDSGYAAGYGYGYGRGYGYGEGTAYGYGEEVPDDPGKSVLPWAKWFS